MPYGDWINELPTAFFMVVHIAAFALGAGFAWLAFKRELSLLGTGFALYAVAEVVYMTYHLDWTVFLFAHTIAEVLDLAAFVAVFAAAVWQVAGEDGDERREVEDLRDRVAGRRRPPPRARAHAAGDEVRRLATLAVVALAAGCGGGEEAAPVETTEVLMAKSYVFEPERIAISAGETVTWTNDDNFTHTVQVDGQEDHEVEQGESVSIAFDEPGTYHYVCTLHRTDMEGEVIVR